MDVLAEVNLKKRLVLVLLAALVIGGVGIFGGYFYKQQQALADERDSLTATGTIEARTAMASFKVPGRIESLLVDEGSQVKEGQELARLENDELAAKLAQANGALNAYNAQAQAQGAAVPLASQTADAKIGQLQAQVAQAEVAVREAKQVYDRVKLLHDNGAVSDKDFDDATNNYEAAQKKLDEARSGLAEAQAARANIAIEEAKYRAALGQKEGAQGAVQEAQAYLNDTHLYSPFTGFITQRFLEQGEMVNAGTPVFEVSDLKHPYVKVYIDEKKIGRVHLNQQVEVRVDAYPKRVFKGKVVWIRDAGDFAVKKALNEEYDHDIRSFEVKIDVPNPDLALKTGMTARVRILEGGR